MGFQKLGKKLFTFWCVDNFFSGTKVGDVALFKIEPEEVFEEFRENHQMSDMSLSPKDFDPTGLACVVSGWGHTREGSNQAPHVLQVLFCSEFFLFQLTTVSFCVPE